ncbi:hypothetical protein CR513_10109, partial [Mucuna pruriens]
MLNGINFKVWKKVMEIIFDCMNLDLTLRIEKLIPTLENLEKGVKMQGSSLKKSSNSLPK